MFKLSSPKLTKKTLTENLQQVASKIKRVPSRAEYRARKNKSHAASSTIEDRFGSWAKATRKIKL